MVWECTCGRRNGKNRDVTVVRYVQLAHNRRVDGVTQAEVLLNLGREDLLDPDGLRRLVRSINRYLGEDGGGGDVPVGDGLSIVASRPMGVAWLLDGLWRELGVDTALAAVLGGRRFTTDVERVLFALVANRAIDPGLEARRRGVGIERRRHFGVGRDG
jgi:hypothetical protein